MTTHIGSEGSVAVGANAVAEVTSFSYTTEATLTPDTVLGDSWESHKVGTKRWSGSVSCFWDGSDTNGQVALVEGASVTLNLYPEGSTSADEFVTGTVTISGVEVSVGGNDEITTATFNFQGNGAMTRDTVA